MNRVILVGRLAKDPELKMTSNNLEVCRFTVATSRHTKEQEEADFINCIAWRSYASTIGKYCVKGSLVAIEGRLNNRSYTTQDGTKRYVTEVVVENIELLGKPKTTSETSVESKAVPEKETETDPFEDFSQEVAIDDLPF